MASACAMASASLAAWMYLGGSNELAVFAINKEAITVHVSEFDRGFTDAPF